MKKSLFRKAAQSRRGGIPVEDISWRGGRMLARLGLGRIALLALPLLAAACTALPIPGAGGVANLYNLTPKSSFSPGLPRADWQLVVEEPSASGGLESRRIVLKPTPTEVKYFADVRWAARAPKMVQTLLVESFDNSERIVAVGRQAIGLRSDFNLKSELREFQAEYFHGKGAPVVNVRLNVKLIRQPYQEIVASETFSAQVKSEGRDMQSIVQAFDAALGKVLRRVVEWTLTTPASSRPTS